MLVRVLETVGSPTARKHSLLFGGAYAPNDAIYRKRYAFTDALIKLLVFFGHFTKNSYQLFFPRLPAASTKKTVYDGLFFILTKLARTRTHLAQFILFALS